MEEKKKRKYTEAQNKATQKYIAENLEEIRFRVRKGEKQKYVDAAKNLGLSMAQFFVDAGNEKIQRETQQPEPIQEEKKEPEPAKKSITPAELQSIIDNKRKERQEHKRAAETEALVKFADDLDNIDSRRKEYKNNAD